MKKITQKEAKEKYGCITSGANSLYTYFLRDDGSVVDNDGDVRFIPENKRRFLGAVERIIEEVKEKRKGDCFNKNCVVNQMIGGNDIDIVEDWVKKN